MELVCIFIGNNKQTTDLVKGLQYFTGKENAKEFYITKGIMNTGTVNTMNWDDIHDTLALEPKM